MYVSFKQDVSHYLYALFVCFVRIIKENNEFDHIEKKFT